MGWFFSMRAMASLHLAACQVRSAVFVGPFDPAVLDLPRWRPSEGMWSMASSAQIWREVARMAAHSADEIILPSGWRMARSMGGRDGFDAEGAASSSFWQSSRVQRISCGYCGGRVADRTSGTVATCSTGAS
jgi:hypothetical protein